MKTKFLAIAILCFIGSSVYAQTNINNYKYVIVPDKYDFLKEKDQYQLNSLTHFLFNKYGFHAVLEGSDYPQDLMSNRCLALVSDVVKGAGMFKTKLNIVLKDCNSTVVFTSKEGESREKDFKTSYNLALRDAFKSIETLYYKYKPSENITSLSTINQPQANTEVTQEIQQLKKEIQNLKKQKEAEVAVVEKPKKIGAPKVVKQIQQPKVDVKKDIKETPVVQGVSNVLYAQAIDNGFQLVDSAPKVLYRIKNTNLKDVFIVEGESAIIYKNGTDWVIEYYSGVTLKQEALNIKF